MENNNHDHEHDHDHGCKCGCNEHDTVKLTLEDDSEIECEVIGTFDLNEKNYIALLPVDDEDVLIYNFEDLDGELQLNTIEDEAEFEEVSAAFFELFDDEEDEDEEYDEEDDDEEYDDEDLEEDEE